MKYTAIYLRLSSDDDDIDGIKTESTSIEGQRNIIRSFINNNLELSHTETKEYVDDGYSGCSFNRPAITELLEDLRKGVIGCIIVKDLSRFGRNFVETGEYIEQIFPLLNVRFIAITDNYDSYKSQVTEMSVPLKNLMNEMYSTDISKKIKSTLKIHKEKGYFSGKPPLGYILRDHKLYIDKKAAEYVRYIFSLAENGMTITEITKKLNKEKIPTASEYFGYSKNTLWVRDIVKRVLQNTVYIGTVTRNKNTNIRPRTEVSNDKSEWLVFENSHQPIISKETFEKVQKMFTNKKNGNRGGNYYPELKGKIKCGACGRTARRMNKYRVKDGSLKRIYCVCGTQLFEDCFTDKVNIIDIKDVIVKHLETLMQFADINLSTVKSAHKEISSDKTLTELEKQIETANNRKLLLYTDYKSGMFSIEKYLRKREEVIKLINALQIKLDSLMSVVKLPSDIETAENILNGYKDKSTTIEDIIQKYLKEVKIFSKDRFEIVWNLPDIFNQK